MMTGRIETMAGRFTVSDVITSRELSNIGTFFPPANQHQIKKLKMTQEAIYSTTNTKCMHRIVDVIEETLGRSAADMVITDATSNVGGSVLGFAIRCSHVNAVEIDCKTYELLVNNINAYGFSNVCTYNTNYLTIARRLRQDVIFIDPPWGGPEYKKRSRVSLFLGGEKLSDIVKMTAKNAELILLKVPRNFDRSAFQKSSGFTPIYVFIGSFVLAVIAT